MKAVRSRRRFIAEGVALASAGVPWRAGARPADAAAALPASDAFAANLVREVVAANPQGNVVLSPFSVQGALALAALGARGSTRETLQSVVGLPALDTDTLRAWFDTPLLQSSRAVFVRRAHIAASYAQAASRALGATVRPLPDDPHQAGGVINAWADEATHHRIATVCDDVAPGVPLVLADAVHLQFRWQQAFRQEATRDLPFHRGPHDVVDVPTMSTTLSAVSGSCSVGQFVRLGLEGSGGGVHLVLPRPGLSAEAALDGVLRDPHELDAGPDRWHDVELSVPRFELRSAGALAPALARLGLAPLFARADLAGIAPALSDSQLSEVLQQAWMKVDEQGVEAAAVTLVSVTVTGMMMRQAPPRLKLVFDRPFALVIRDKAALFAAVVRDPSLRA